MNSAAKLKNLNPNCNGWSDAQGEENGTQAKRTAQSPTNRDDHNLKKCADQRDGLMRDRLEPSHEAISGSRS